MKKLAIHILIITVAATVISCGSAATRADKEDGSKNENATKSDTAMVNAPQENAQNRSAPSGYGAYAADATANNDILAHIDQYLLSSTVPDPAPSAGGILRLQNTLSDIGFQKVMVEISVLNDKKEICFSDYLTFINLEPGETKSLRLPKNDCGSVVNTHVIKIKSDKLTNGEMLLVGQKFTVK